MHIIQHSEVVKLVDRLCKGDDEITADGQQVKLGMETLVHRDFVHWMYRNDKRRVWAKDGGDGMWVHRYAVENPSQWLVDHCGPEVGDTSPIELDPTHIEGWDTSGVDRSQTKFKPINVPPSELRERNGNAVRVARAR